MEEIEEKSKTDPSDELKKEAEEIEKTKTRIVTTQHYQSGDIASGWSPSANIYDVKTIEVNPPFSV